MITLKPVTSQVHSEITRLVDAVDVRTPKELKQFIKYFKQHGLIEEDFKLTQPVKDLKFALHDLIETYRDVQPVLPQLEVIARTGKYTLTVINNIGHAYKVTSKAGIAAFAENNNLDSVPETIGDFINLLTGEVGHNEEYVPEKKERKPRTNYKKLYEELKAKQTGTAQGCIAEEKREQYLRELEEISIDPEESKQTIELIGRIEENHRSLIKERKSLFDNLLNTTYGAINTAYDALDLTRKSINIGYRTIDIAREGMVAAANFGFAVGSSGLFGGMGTEEYGTFEFISLPADDVMDVPFETVDAHLLSAAPDSPSEVGVSQDEYDSLLKEKERLERLYNESVENYKAVGEENNNLRTDVKTLKSRIATLELQGQTEDCSVLLAKKDAAIKQINEVLRAQTKKVMLYDQLVEMTKPTPYFTPAELIEGLGDGLNSYMLRNEELKKYIAELEESNSSYEPTEEPANAVKPAPTTSQPGLSPEQEESIRQHFGNPKFVSSNVRRKWNELDDKTQKVIEILRDKSRGRRVGPVPQAMLNLIESEFPKVFYFLDNWKEPIAYGKCYEADVPF